MKKIVQRGVVLALSLVMGAGLAASGLKTSKQRVSYAIGFQTGKALAQHQVQVDSASFSLGLKDAMNKRKPKLTEDEMRTAITNMQKQVMQKMQSQAKKLGQTNLKTSEAFLAANKSKTGVKVTKSGLQYKVMTAGTGPMPTSKDTVTVDYEGSLINGKVFDSSYKRGKPASFPVGGVVKGWQEALQLMKVGATWMLYVPADLAYGASGAGGMIGPNQALIFKVHLIKINSPAKSSSTKK